MDYIATSTLFILKRIFSTILFSIFFSLPYLVFSQNIYDAEHSEKYADYLLKTKQYNLAIDELQRLIFLAPQNEPFKISLGNCFIQSGNYTEGIKKLRVYYTELNEMPSGIAFIFSRLLLLGDSVKSAATLCSLNQNLTSAQKKFIEINSILLQGKWCDSRKLLEQSSNQLPAELTEQFENLISEAICQKRKSPLIAFLLSLPVPGAGKFYTNDWLDGTLSLMLVGVTGFQSYRGFSKKGIKSVYGWIFAGFSAGFYGGNLYGSVAAAKRYNMIIKNQYIEKVKDIIRNCNL